MTTLITKKIGVAVITTAHFHLAKPELNLSAGSNTAFYRPGWE